MNIERIQQQVIIIGMIFLALSIILCLVRATLGPRFTDRLLGINVINIKVIILICIMAVIFEKSYIVDIALVYSAISFLSVIVLSKLFLKDYLNDKKGGGGDGVN